MTEQSIQQQWNQTGEATLHIGRLNTSRDLATDFENIQQMIRLPDLKGFHIYLQYPFRPINPFFMVVKPNLPRQEESRVVRSLLALAALSHGRLTVTAAKQPPKHPVISLPYQEIDSLLQDQHSRQ